MGRTWIIIIDKETCIESTIENGVHLRSLSERIEEVLKTRKPVNESPSDDSFVIRRWHQNFKPCVMRSTK